MIAGKEMPAPTAIDAVSQRGFRVLGEDGADMTP
jgi:hypothetical protein